MKSNKQNPITFFRKSFEDREKRIKSSIKKYAKGGPEGTPEETPKPAATTEKTEEQKAAEAKAAAAAKAKALGSMTGKQYRQEKRGHKRAAKLERIANGTQGERTNAIITAIGNAANAANTIMQTTGQAKETFGKQKRGGAIVKKKMATGGTNKKPLPKAQDGKFQQVNAINPNYKMDKDGAMFPKTSKPNYTSNNTNLLGRNVKTDYNVEKGTIAKTVTNRKGEVVRQSQPRVLNSKKVERKMTRQMGRDASTDPSESSSSFARKGGVTKAKRFAALAPPYNKATAADRIAGAKKNARKK